MNSDSYCSENYQLYQKKKGLSDLVSGSNRRNCALSKVNELSRYVI